MDATKWPPLVKRNEQGIATWQRLEGLDYETLGFFLSCHLIIEHYIDAFLKFEYPKLDWAATRITFNQKLALLSKFASKHTWSFIPAIKHMNALRNKLSHNIEFRIGAHDLLPLTEFLTKRCKDRTQVPKIPKAIMEQFTFTSCAYFEGWIARVSWEEETRKGT